MWRTTQEVAQALGRGKAFPGGRFNNSVVAGQVYMVATMNQPRAIWAESSQQAMKRWGMAVGENQSTRADKSAREKVLLEKTGLATRETNESSKTSRGRVSTGARTGFTL